MSSIDVSEILRGSSTNPPPAKKARSDVSHGENGLKLPAGASRDELLAALEEDAGQAVTVDEAYVKKYTLQLEKKVLRNREMRIKHSDEPQKFMESEIELDTAIQEMHSLATQPDLYGCFIEVGGPTILLSLLAHENSDIVGVTINLLQELTDMDVLNEGDEGALELIDYLIKGRIIETFVTCFDKFDEAKKDDADALHGALTVVENMIEVRKEMADECVSQGLFLWLLKRACQKGIMDANKEYASELLAILLQTSDAARKKLTEKLDGIDMILRALAHYKRNDPTSPTEKEHMENMFNALCAALIWPQNRGKFLDGEGLQLMNLMLREKKQSRNSALKVLDHATAGPEGRDNCNKFVDILGLRTLFPLFMKTPTTTKKKSKDSNPDEHEEHVCSVLGALLRSCEEESRQRMFNKFVEHEHEKVDRAVELFLKYKERMIKFDSKQAKAAEASDNEQENDDEKYFDRLDAGLFTLQTVSLILLDVCSNTYSALQRTSKLFSMKLKQERVSKIAAQYQQNLGADAQEEAGRVDRLMAKLSSLEKDLHA